MIVNFYSLRDSVGEMFEPPFLAHNDGLAGRAIIHNCRDQNSRMYLCQKDLWLYQVGSFDDVSGLLGPLHEPRKIINLHDLLTAQGAS